MHFAKHRQDTTVSTAARTAGAVAVCKEGTKIKGCASDNISMPKCFCISGMLRTGSESNGGGLSSKGNM